MTKTEDMKMQLNTAVADNANVSFEVAPPSREAAELVMSWRNDGLARQQSFHQQEKTWPEFFNEYKDSYLGDSSLPCFFALENGRRIGFLRFRRLVDPRNANVACADISINIAPECRGRGLGTKVLQQLMPIVRNIGLASVLAEVKLENVASQTMFKKAGFTELDICDHIIDGQEMVKVVRFIYDLVVTCVVPGTNRIIGDGQKCFVIAEAGSNWRMGTRARDLAMGRTLIDVAVEAGADAVKFQTYKPETTYVKNAGESDYLSEAGIKESITDIFADLAMPYDMVKELWQYAERQGIIFMSSAFSIDDLNAVDPYTPLHKIASYEISHARLIEAVAKTGKPLILSSGASNLDDIAWAVEHFRAASSAGLCLMQCTARYPAPVSALNLRTIAMLKILHGVPVGLSDHSRDPIIGPVTAVALGANLIEKHYTVDNKLPGPDHAFAVTPVELKAMVDAIRQAEEAVGSGVKAVLPEEEELYWYARRGLQVIKDIQVGESFTEDQNFAILRPGKQRRGIHPKFIEQVLKSKATRAMKSGEGIQDSDYR